MTKRLGQRYAEMRDAELIALFKEVYESVYLIDCFGTRDLIELDMLERELDRRGYAIRPTLPEVVKAEAEEDESAGGDGPNG